MANTPLLPSVKNLLNYADSAGHSNSHVVRGSHRSSTSHLHSSSASKQGYHSSRHSSSRTDKHVSSRSIHRENRDHPILPSVHEVLHGVPHKHMSSSQSRSHSSRVGHTPMEGVEYERKSRESSSNSKKQGYPCERCGRLFTRKSDALKHIRVVHDRLKVFACSVCGRKFARKDYCTKHEKSLHNITPPPTQYQLRRQVAKEQAENRHRGMH